MRKILPLLCASLLLMTQAITAQEYAEAIGQTAVFALVDPTTSVQPAKKALRADESMKIVLVSSNRVQNCFRITGGIPGIARLYQLNGREIGNWPVGKSGLLILNRHFSTEVYVLRFKPEGMPAKTFRLPVMLKGGRS